MTTDPTLVALLHAILADPEDDAPRLMYVDRCEELGDDARAEFIRVQMALAGLDPYHRSCTGGKCPGCSDLRRRASELLGITGHRSGWIRQAFERMASYVSVSTDGNNEIVRLFGQYMSQTVSFSCAFHRGFIAEISCTLADWRNCGPQIVACQPVETVVLTDREPSRHSSGRCWWWFADGNESDRSADRLPREWLSRYADYYVTPTRDDSMKFASQYAIAWARRQAWDDRLVPQEVAVAWGVTKKEILND